MKNLFPFLLIALLAVMVCDRCLATTKILSTGQMLMVRDAQASHYGAIRVEKIDPKNNQMVFRWFLLPEQVYDLGDARVRSGTVEVSQVRGKAAVAFGPFVLEWHGSSEQKGIFSANGALGTQPLLVASSGIHDPTRIRDVREGYQYEAATSRESPSPLGLDQTFADLPPARLGLAVAETFVPDENGYEILSLRIVRVDEDSKAYEAGVRENQELVSLNGKEIYSTAEFRDSLKKIKPGDTVTLGVLESGEQKFFRYEADPRVGASSVRALPTPDPNMSPEEKERLQKNQEVLHVMQEAVEALRAIHFD